MMETPYDIIIRPLVTEKSVDMAAMRKYVFRVPNEAKKIQIKQAVEALFKGTKVEKVATMRVSGKLKRRGRTTGRTASWKKAIVTLTVDSKPIEVFES